MGCNSQLADKEEIRVDDRLPPFHPYSDGYSNLQHLHLVYTMPFGPRDADRHEHAFCLLPWNGPSLSNHTGLGHVIRTAFWSVVYNGLQHDRESLKHV